MKNECLVTCIFDIESNHSCNEHNVLAFTIKNYKGIDHRKLNKIYQDGKYIKYNFIEEYYLTDDSSHMYSDIKEEVETLAAVGFKDYNISKIKFIKRIDEI